MKFNQVMGYLLQGQVVSRAAWNKGKRKQTLQALALPGLEPCEFYWLLLVTGRRLEFATVQSHYLGGPDLFATDWFVVGKDFWDEGEVGEDEEAGYTSVCDDVEDD